MVVFVLVLGLFLPRLALLIGYIGSGILPNPIHLFWDIVLALFVPRILFICYIAYNWETLPGAGWWLTFHIIGLLLSMGSRSKDD